MSTIDRFEDAMAAVPLVAILRGVTPDTVLPVADALMAGGFRLIEVPLNSPDAFTSIERLVAHCPPEVLVGAGTVLTPADARRLAETGASLLVTPNTDADVIATAADSGLIPLPGCLTPSECFTALKAGARGLKIFPASRMGAAYLKDLRAVLPKGTPLLPVGGMDVGTMAEWRATGAAGFGFGSNLFAPGREPALIEEAARALCAEWRRIAP
ncbi:2-dehydro-3-deoxy-6-phosphogalactonate aldolase [Caenispirillum bisanense]|uniref:2-keto-3-deoxy-phosphogalactonate aldolase n=1 Tax=Caenispirillum bisanense TaxID=414052 RepID=A0A286GN81_9PROT|nr:2-dehydro-3-deoxy-6-phosphogalactonate aldolase [Caenispirillum bisanense]SOD96952.1 2-keto-3-deoxy-phosphogalactonate aldolase [Caenispirillum bisanense]